jgi:hypothetical protein
MAIVLKPYELRVLGVLIEKSMTVPQYYPMTLNAVTAACNQKNNRSPVSSLTEGDVGTAMHELARWQLVSQAPPEPGSRTNKFLHEVEKRFGWTSPQRAIMAELMLRGPQTLGELRTNASRMTRLDATDYVREVLGELSRMDPPMAMELPRQRGQREARFAQLLGGPVNETAFDAPAMQPPAPATREQTASEPGGLEARVEVLEAQVAALRMEVAELRGRMGP